MRKRKYTCLDLRDNSIDIEAIGKIAKDSAKYHIYGLRFWFSTYSIHKERLPRRAGLNKSSVEVIFSKNILEAGVRRTTLEGKVRFFSGGCYYLVRMKLTAEASYDFEPYDIKIQDYLYSYFAHVIENDFRIQKYKSFTLPSNLSNYTAGAEWDNQEIVAYHWMDYWNNYPTTLPLPLTLEKVERESSNSSLYKLITKIRNTSN